MEIFLAKFLPLFLYPLGLACVLLVVVLLTKHWSRWGRIGVLIALVLLLVAGNHWVSHGLARSLEWRYVPESELPDAEVIVVLGGGTVAAQEPRPIVEVNSAGDRVIYAAWLYHQGAANHLLVSGGRIPFLSSDVAEQDTPARNMAILLEMFGVPDDAIWQEGVSQNTYENALYSRQMLQEKGIDRIILVTSAIHMPRSVRFYEAQGFEVIPAPVDYHVTQSDSESLKEFNFVQEFMRLFPTADNLALTTQVMKEYIGILFYNLKGWN